jgi:pimeloyl-ACP methyl ester carboxylesterase
MRKQLSISASLFALSLSVASAQTSVLSIDHYVPNVSKAPVMAGETAQIYVRERVSPGQDAKPVVLFVHGAGTPAEVAFDVPLAGYSWMAHLASAGFDTFAMDTTGYGRSTRPYPMNDICNLSEAQQQDFIPGVIAHTCPPTYAFATTTIESDWDDIDAVVDYVRKLRGVDKVHLVAWSLGGPRAAGYTALHPEKVDRLVLLAPAYGRTRSSTPPESLPLAGVAFNKQSASDFVANWDRQVGCENQYAQPVKNAVWGAMLDSDPVGATWGTGVRRAPATTVWGWNAEVVAKTRHPMLLVSPVHDKQVPAARVRELYEDLGAEQKVLLDLGCSSHNAMWEINHELLFDASLQWLRDGAVDGVTNGELQKGY